MSLIRAVIVEDEIIIVSDNKLTYKPKHKEHYTQNSLASGTIKTIIISEKICLSYAGQDTYYISALKKIGTSRDVAFLVEILHKINIDSIEAGNDTEFILAYYDNESHIIEIKESKIRHTDSSWIGERGAFNEFQKNFHNHSEKEIIEGCKFSIKRIPDHFSEEQSQILSKLQNSMEAVVNNESIEEVGGFVVTVAKLDGAFSYLSQATTYRQPLNTNELNGPINFTGSDRGGMTINFFTSTKDAIAIHIYQGNLGILFLKNEYMFMEPHIFSNYDEIDFVDEMKQKYNIDGAFGIQANHRLYSMKAQEIYQTNTKKAIRFINEAKESIKNEMRKSAGNRSKFEPLSYYTMFSKDKRNILARYYYNLGVCYHMINDIPMAIDSFNNSVIVDKDYEDARRALFIILRKSTI